MDHQRQYFRTDRNWFVYTDLGFALVFTTEATIKVIESCLSEPPTLTHSVINTIPSINPQELRKNAFGVQILNVSDSAKDTFHSVIIVGGWKVIAAAAVSMSFLIPCLSEPPTLTHSVINTIPSINPQELRKNAFGVQKRCVF
jgi:hypothetical protein